MKPSLRPLLAAVLALAAALLWSAPAAAHGGAKITVNHDGRGSIWVTVTHDDGHPADEFIDATLNAREATGAAVEPAKMVQSSAPGTLVYMSTLPVGAWTVTVEFGPPIARTCTAAFQVGTSNATQTSPCDAPTAVAASAPALSRGGGSNTTAWLLIGVAAAGGIACAVLAVMLRRRRDTARTAGPARRPTRKTKAGAGR